MRWVFMELLIFILLLVGLLGASAFFSGAETALFSLGRARLLSWRGAAERGKRLASELMSGEEYHRTLIAIVLGNMFVNSAFSITEERLLDGLDIGPVLTSALSIVVSVLLLLLFGEITPKAFAITCPESVSLRVSGAIAFFRKLFHPLVVLLDKVFSIVLDVLGRRRPQPLTREEYSAFLASALSSGAFSPEEARLFEEVFEFGAVSVSSVARSRVDAKLLKRSYSPRFAGRVIRSGRMMYYPVVESDWDDAVGFVSAKVFFSLPSEGRERWSERCLIPAVFIPEGAALVRALASMRDAGVPVAFTVDEYGGVTGFLALKDLYSELLAGMDASGVEAAWHVRKKSAGKWVLSGLVSLPDLEELTGVEFDGVVSNTVNGLFCELLGRIPRKGDTVEFKGLRFDALEVDRNRVVEVEMRWSGRSAKKGAR